MTVDRSVPSVSHLHRGGMFEAQDPLGRFLIDRFGVYEQHRNQPQTDDTSFLSMYLHYGHVSPVEIALQSSSFRRLETQIDDFSRGTDRAARVGLQLRLVRTGLRHILGPARVGTQDHGNHRNDERRNLYTRTELENAETHDRYWNAAMVEMREDRLHAQLHADVLGQEDPRVDGTPGVRLSARPCTSTTSTSSTDEIPTPTPGSDGSSGSTTDRGRSGRSSEPCGT